MVAQPQFSELSLVPYHLNYLDFLQQSLILIFKVYLGKYSDEEILRFSDVSQIPFSKEKRETTYLYNIFSDIVFNINQTKSEIKISATTQERRDSFSLLLNRLARLLKAHLIGETRNQNLYDYTEVYLFLIQFLQDTAEHFEVPFLRDSEKDHQLP